MSTSSKARRSQQATKVAARSASASGTIKCFVEATKRPDGRPDFALLEKKTRRRLRILADGPVHRAVSPMSNLLRDCYAHGGGLIDQWKRTEHIAISAPVFTQDSDEIAVWLDADFSVKVSITTADVASPPVSVWCYIEEYAGTSSDVLGLRLREKETGRKVEIFGKSKEHLTKFLASPTFTGVGAMMPNLTEKNGFRDYVLVSGGTAVNSYDVLLFDEDAALTYLLGPSPDTAYRDAFRALETESATDAQARTARSHLAAGHYREAILAARLAVETACGGRSSDVRAALANSPQSVMDAGNTLHGIRHVAVHEGDTRIEQPVAAQALQAMETVLDYLKSAPSTA